MTQVESMSARPRPPEQLAALFAGGWPAFIDADPIAAGCLPWVLELFGGLEIVLTGDADGDTGGDLVAAYWGVPIRLNEYPANLPTGYSESRVRALDDHGVGAGCETLVVCAAQVRPDRARAGMAAAALGALFDAAAERGLTRVIAPLRLTGKHPYPLTPIQQYASWTRDLTR